MRLRDAGVDLQQPDLVLHLVPVILDVEAGIVIADMRHDLAGDLVHLVLDPARQGRGVEIVEKAEHLRVADRIDRAIGHHLALMHIALDGALPPADHPLGHAVMALDRADVVGQIGLLEHVVERLGDLADLGAKGGDGVVEILGAVDAEAETRARGLDRLDEERKAQIGLADLRQRVVVEGIERGKGRRVVGHNLGHHLARPVLVLAFQQAFQRGVAGAVFLAQQRQHGGNRKVDIADDRVDRALMRIERRLGLGEHRGDVEILRVRHRLGGQQRVKLHVLDPAQPFEPLRVQVVHADHKDMLGHVSDSLLLRDMPVPGRARIARPRGAVMPVRDRPAPESCGP